MSVTYTLQDILNQTDDFSQNYSVTTIDLGNKIRAANRAIEFVQERLGLPSDRKILTFNYYQDIPFYDLTSDYNDAVTLYYNTVNANVFVDNNDPYHRWYEYEDNDILRTTGQHREQNRFAFTTINGKNQLVLDGNNIRASTLINALNSTTGITFSSSITAPAADANIYTSGGASVAFGVSNAESVSSITIPGNFDIRQLLNSSGAYRMSVFFPTGVGTNDFTNIELDLVSSAGNYYSMTATTDYLGAAWASNGWSRLSFNLSSAVSVGTPDASAITSLVIKLNHAGGFSTVTNMRINNLYTVQPDIMNFIFYSTYKGTDISGTVSKILLDTPSDILSFASLAPDLIYPIALKAATILWPQLRADIQFQSVYKNDFTETILLYGKKYPRKRNSVSSQTQFAR